MDIMDKVVRKFGSFAEAEKADREYYRSLTGQQRLDLLLELIASTQDTEDEAAKGFERVYRIIKRR
jgi:hypothetical protein